MMPFWIRHIQFVRYILAGIVVKRQIAAQLAVTVACQDRCDIGKEWNAH